MGSSFQTDSVWGGKESGRGKRIGRLFRVRIGLRVVVDDVAEGLLRSFHSSQNAVWPDWLVVLKTKSICRQLDGSASGDARSFFVLFSRLYKRFTPREHVFGSEGCILTHKSRTSQLQMRTCSPNSIV